MRTAIRAGMFVVLASLLGLVGQAHADTNAILTHGPVIGGVTSNSAVVFVRTDRTATVNIRYALTPNLLQHQVSPDAVTTEQTDRTVLIPLTGLGANSIYYLNVLVDGQPAPDSAAQFKTFPPAGTPARLTFAVLNDFGSYGEGDQPPLDEPTNTFKNADSAYPDFVFIGGDFDHRNPKTLDEKRQMFKDLYSAANPRANMPDFVPHILRRYPVAHQWDDHDFHDNDADRTSYSRADASKAYREYVPSYPFPDAGAIYQSFQYGDIDFFILDNRYYRDPNHDPQSPTKSMLNGEHLWQQGQLGWLKRGLKKSQARWKIVFSSSVFNPTLQKSDSWTAFAKERQAVTRVIRENGIKNVLFISGDIHAGALDDGTNALFPMMIAPGPNLRYCFTTPEGWPGKWSHGIYGSPLRQDNAIPCNGYGLVKITKKAAKLMILDTEGAVKLKMVVPYQP